MPPVHPRIRRAFNQVAERFVARGLLKWVPTVEYGKPHKFPRSRDCAFTDGRTVRVARKMDRADTATLWGVLAHELGHCVAIQHGWNDHTEVDADDLAGIGVGERIGYDAHDIQRLHAWKRRPPYLPK